jgi:hypothetical protein
MLKWRNLDLKVMHDLFHELRELDIGVGETLHKVDINVDGYKVPYVFDVASAAINIHARNRNADPKEPPETVMTLYVDWSNGETYIDNRIADSTDDLTEVPPVEAIEFWDNIWKIVAKKYKKLRPWFTPWFVKRYM